MIRKSLIALAAASGLALAFAPAAEAKTKINIDVNFGFGGYGPYGPLYAGYYSYPFGYDCGYRWVAYKKWNHWHTAYKIKHKKVLICG